MAIFGISFKDNKEQAELVRQIMDRNQTIIFGLGKAGTGKNFAAIACALHLQDNNEYSDIYYARNPVQCGEDMGFLPGDLNDKYDPFMEPLKDTIKSIVNKCNFFEKKQKTEKKAQVEHLLKQIICLPLAFIRGRTIDDAIIIIDECQNLDANTLRTLMTRLGKNSKLVLLGSYNQIDQKEQKKQVVKHGKCDFQRVAEWFMTNRPEYSGGIELIKSMRSPICVDIDESFDEIFTE